MPALKIECTKLRTEAGQIVAVAWNQAENFRSDDASKAVATRKVAVSGKTVVVDLGDLPVGEYAVAILHDENDNEKLDVTPLLHLPMEGLAFSNNPTMGLKGPDWSRCMFKHEADQTLSVTLKYWR